MVSAWATICPLGATADEVAAAVARVRRLYDAAGHYDVRVESKPEPAAGKDGADEVEVVTGDAVVDDALIAQVTQRQRLGRLDARGPARGAGGLPILGQPAGQFLRLAHREPLV